VGIASKRRQWCAGSRKWRRANGGEAFFGQWRSGEKNEVESTVFQVSTCFDSSGIQEGGNPGMSRARESDRRPRRVKLVSEKCKGKRNMLKLMVKGNVNWRSRDDKIMVYKNYLGWSLAD
jgi:hypothetical protein